MTLEDALDAVIARHKNDSGRLAAVADFAMQELVNLGLPRSEDNPMCQLRGGGEGELSIPGLARTKDWDVAFEFAGKARLLLSLKSIWANASGTVPNRIDDLMGEAANVQQRSPEIVIGYILLFATPADRYRKEDSLPWSVAFEKAVERIAIRRFPLWNQGLVESMWFVRFDPEKDKGKRIVEPVRVEASADRFFRSLLCELRLREPAIPFTRTLTCEDVDAAGGSSLSQKDLKTPPTIRADDEIELEE